MAYSDDRVATGGTARPEHRYARRSANIGRGDVAWREARHDVLHWAVKTRSGFRVRPDDRVRVGARPLITIGPPGLRIHEPVEVVEVVDEADHVGFRYRALPGHPVRGEERFTVSRAGDQVRLVVESWTSRSPQQPWRALWPLLLVAQAVAHRRYLRALR